LVGDLGETHYTLTHASAAVKIHVRGFLIHAVELYEVSPFPNFYFRIPASDKYRKTSGLSPSFRPEFPKPDGSSDGPPPAVISDSSGLHSIDN